MPGRLAVPWHGCALCAPFAQSLVPWPRTSCPVSMLSGPRDGFPLASSWGALGFQQFVPPKDLPSSSSPLQDPLAASNEGGWRLARWALQCCPQPLALLGATFAFRMMPSVLNHARQPVLPPFPSLVGGRTRMAILVYPCLRLGKAGRCWEAFTGLLLLLVSPEPPNG